MNNILNMVPQTSIKASNSFSLILSASPVVKFVLLVLMFFSVVSWAVIIFKLFEYKKAKKNSAKFINYFRKTKNFSDIHKFSQLLKNNPLAKIFKYGYKEISIQMGPDCSPENKDTDSVHRALISGSSSEITRLERLNGFLATTATVTPFIGLFGTVWGIMSSFHSIGVQGNANLTTVAPGIAEALIATALGLFAAIPAVIFYNLLLNKLKVLISIMEEFIYEFLNVSEKIK